MSKSTRHDDVSGGGSLYTPPSQGDEDDPLDSYGAARVNSADSLGSTRAHSGNFVDKGYRKRLLECSDVEDDVTTLCVTPWGRSATFDNRLSRWMNKAERRIGAVAKQQSHPVETVGKRKQDRGSRHKDKWRDGRHNMAGAIGTDIRYTVPSDLDYKQHIKMYRQQYTYKQKHKHSQQNGAAGHHGNGNHGGSVMTSSSNYRPSGDYVCYKPMTASNTAKHTHTPTQTGKLKYDHRQTSPKTLSFAHARTQSEPDILDLQHRYKLDPGAIKAALVANLGQLTNQSEPASSSQEANSSARIDIDTKPWDDTGDDPNGGLTKINGYWKNPVRSTSARSAKATIQSRSSGTVNLTPTSAVRHGANGVATSATRQQNVRNTSRVGSVANTSAAASRGAARQPIECVTLEPLVTSSTHSMPATILAQKTADESNGTVPVPLTDRSPPHFAMAANNLRTLDLLSNMNSLDKQMYIDREMSVERQVWREQLERLLRIPPPTRIVSSPEQPPNTADTDVTRKSKRRSPAMKASAASSYGKPLEASLSNHKLRKSHSTLLLPNLASSTSMTSLLSSRVSSTGIPTKGIPSAASIGDKLQATYKAYGVKSSLKRSRTFSKSVPEGLHRHS